MRFTEFDAILFDMDGTLYRVVAPAGRPRHHRPEFAAAANRSPASCCNKRLLPPRAVSRLAAMGLMFPLPPFTRPAAAVDWMLGSLTRRRV